MLRSLVRCLLVRLPSQREPRVGNSVAATTDNGTQVLGIVAVFLDRVEPDHDVCPPTMRVGSHHRHDDAAVIRGANFEAVRVLECEDVGYGRGGIENRYA